MKKALTIKSALSVLCILAMLLSLLVSCGSETTLTVEEQLKRAPQMAAQAAEGWDYVGNVSKALNGGAVTVCIEPGKSYTGDYKNASLSLKAFSDLENKAGAFELLFKGTKDYLAKAYVDDKAVILKSEDLLGGSYGMPVDGVGDLLSSLLLANNEGKIVSSDGGIVVGDEFEQISGEGGADVAGMIVSTLLPYADKIDELENKYSLIILNTLFEKKALSMETAEVSVLDENVKASLVKVTLTKEDVVAIVADVAESAKTDATVKEIVKAIAEKAGEEVTDEEIVKGIDDGVKEIGEALEKVTLNFLINAYLNKNNGALSCLDINGTVEVEGKKAEIAFKLELGKTFEKFEGFRLTMSVKQGEEETETVVLSLKVLEDTEENFKIKFEGSIPDTDMPEMQFEHNRKNGEYTLSLTVPADEESPLGSAAQTITISGNLTKTEKQVVLTIESIGFSGLTISLFKITITVDAEATCEKETEYTDISTLTDEQRAAIGEKVSSSPMITEIGEFFTSMLGMFLGGGTFGF